MKYKKLDKISSFFSILHSKFFQIFTQENLFLLISTALLVIFAFGYLESLRWPFPGPRGTHGIVKGVFLLLSLGVFFNRKRLLPQKDPTQNLLMTFFVFSYVISAAFTFALDAALYHLWYPFIALVILFSFSKIEVPRYFHFFSVIISIVLVFSTFSFSFFSIMFRNSVDNLYYFIFLDHRANHLLNELRIYGKYVSLGPYLMLTPICARFLVERNSETYRKMLSILIILLTVLTAIISNNRIDVLVLFIHFIFYACIFSRKILGILVLTAIPLLVLGLITTRLYFGFNLIERIFFPRVERDLETIDVRFTYWQTAFYNFRSSPLFGTGPNSYNDVSVLPIRNYYVRGVNSDVWRPDEGIGVHNLFIERLSDTGILGFTAFVILLGYFFQKDFKRFFSIQNIEKRKVFFLYSLGSWTWILYGITDNGYGAQGYLTFFFLRGLLMHL